MPSFRSWGMRAWATYLLPKAVGGFTQEVRISMPRGARRSAPGRPVSLRLSYQHNDARLAIDGPVQRDAYGSVAELHQAMGVTEAARGLDLHLVDHGECLIIRKWLPDVVADGQV